MRLGALQKEKKITAKIEPQTCIETHLHQPAIVSYFNDREQACTDKTLVELNGDIEMWILTATWNYITGTQTSS